MQISQQLVKKWDFNWNSASDGPFSGSVLTQIPDHTIEKGPDHTGQELAQAVGGGERRAALNP